MHFQCKYLQVFNPDVKTHTVKFKILQKQNALQNTTTRIYYALFQRDAPNTELYKQRELNILIKLVNCESVFTESYFRRINKCI